MTFNKKGHKTTDSITASLSQGTPTHSENGYEHSQLDTMHVLLDVLLNCLNLQSYTFIVLTSFEFQTNNNCKIYKIIVIHLHT